MTLHPVLRSPLRHPLRSVFERGVGHAAALPVNTLAPSIAGDPYVGEVLTATPGTWTGADSVSGEWYVDGVATGDTDTSYTVLLADAGKPVEYRETATNGAGSVTQASNSKTAAVWTPLLIPSLLAWYDGGDMSTMYQDSAGTTPVVAVDNPVGLWQDKSGSGLHALQATAAARPAYKESSGKGYIEGDATDDRLVVSLPAVTGTLIRSDRSGTGIYGISASGDYSLNTNSMSVMYAPDQRLVQTIIVDGAVSPADAARAQAWCVARGGGVNYSGVTNLYATWRSSTSLTSFPLIDTSSADYFGFAWYDCTSLTSFPLIDTSSGTYFGAAWYNCTSLTSFPLIDTSSGTYFGATWYGCASLTSFPLLDTSSGTDFSYAWGGCTSLTSFPLIDTSSGTNFSYAWGGCTSLTSFPVSFFDSMGVPTNDCFTGAWNGCTSLTNTSVENILVSINASGRSAPATGKNIDISYNAGSGALAAPTTTAITALKAKGWVIVINGVTQ